ncbi:MAG TPA: alpha-N-arabinofuranosidase [Blastococcus sp.]
MREAQVFAHPSFPVADIPRRLFGSFVEHMGRCVYTGIYEPGHETADDIGMRGDVAALVRELGVTTVRYPGGNFVSGYRWEDGVGPLEERPRRLDLAWHSTETNEFGLDEFMHWARATGVEPMLAVNLGTRGPAEALDLLEYCNHPSGSTLSSRRVAHGTKEPHGVRMWCLGNEMDGPWQTGHKTAAEYGRVAAETARAMRQYDPALELVACGSSYAGMPTFGAWEDTVLDLAYDQVDFVSLHAYYEPRDGDVDSFLASGAGMDRAIEQVAATVDAVRARRRSHKTVMLSFDEWNVWHSRHFAPIRGGRWPVAPRLIEDSYDVRDAVVVGGLLISLLRHCDRVRAACLAQLVNVIGPIRTEPGGPAWRQTIFHPFALTARWATGTALRTVVDSPTVGTRLHGTVPAVDGVVTHDHDSVTVLAVNRTQQEHVRLRLDLSAFGELVVREALLLHDDDPDARNTRERPDRVVPRVLPGLDGRHAPFGVELPPISWLAVRLRKATGAAAPSSGSSPTG